MFLGRFSFLLGMLVFMILSAPFTDRWLEREVGALAFRWLFTGIYIAGVASVSRQRWVRWTVAVLFLPAIATEWGTAVAGPAWMAIANTLSTLAFIGFVLGVILHAVLEQRRVMLDTVLGGVCVYLLLAVFWVELYALVEALDPGSFRVGGKPLPEGAVDRQYASYGPFSYFSLVTISTLGYGDIVPVTPVARMVASLEAVVGQLYLAIFVARLVGLHLAQDRDQG